MLSKAWATQAELDRIHLDIRAEVDEAAAWADQSPYPDPSELLDNVYETPSGGGK
jgi:pyruvate dehydrogenase E1 component alpha subunit